MITRQVKEYSVSSISVHFWRKKCCLLRKFARFTCFITYKRVANSFRQHSVKPCSVNFLTMHHHVASVYEKLRFRATTLKRFDAFSNVSGFRSVFKCPCFRKRRPPFSIVAMWSQGENVSKTMRFQIKTH